MAHYVGLDVSVRHTSICIVDDVGKVIRETRVTSEPESIIPILTAQHLACRRIGLEAGPLSQWLFNTLASAGLPVICVETRHMKAALAAQINKTDRNDARGIAQMMRVGLYDRFTSSLKLARRSAPSLPHGSSSRGRTGPLKTTFEDCCAPLA
jgi:transposase